MQFDLFDSTVNYIMGSADYEIFRRKLAASSCARCALHEGRRTIVIDRGNPQSRMMVIGEGPGEQEDLQGKAFVGKAGQLLDKIMASVGLDTNKDMLIVNIVKCRPPENRAPHQEEVDACLPYLRRQIELMRPQIILLLGATALKHMDGTRGTFSMGDEAGRFFTLPAYPGTQFMVLYHPAALLYNAGLKPAMWKHVKDLKKYLDGLP